MLGKMKNNYLVSVNNFEEINEYKKVGINTFLFALEDFSIGYLNTFTVEEINNYVDSYVLINRLLDCRDIDNLKEILPRLNVKGIVYEDIGVFQLIKKLNLNLELIFFQNHFGTNAQSIKYWLDKGVNAVFCSNELTYKEIELLVNSNKNSVVVQVLGYNQAMYSRRLLLSNYHEHFKLVNKKDCILEEINSKMHFRAVENTYGTVLYNGKLFNGLRLTNLDDVRYFYINGTFLGVKKVIEYLNGLKTDCDDGFLEKETIFKLKEQVK